LAFTVRKGFWLSKGDGFAAGPRTSENYVFIQIVDHEAGRVQEIQSGSTNVGAQLLL
jgi:hypothetical protein